MTTEIAEVPKEQQHDYQIFDIENPRSVINIVWPALKTRLIHLQDFERKLFFQSEATMKKRANPTSIEHMLRIRFWAEYDRAQVMGTPVIRQQDVTSGVCSAEYWTHTVITSTEALAFILTPPPRYMSKLEAMLNISIDQLDQILSLPIMNDETGKIDNKLIGHKIKIFESLVLRVKGAIAQKVQIDQRVATKSLDDPFEKMDLTDLHAIEAGLEKVNRQIKRAQNRELPPPREVEVIDIQPVSTSLPDVVNDADFSEVHSEGSYSPGPEDPNSSGEQNSAP